MILKSSVIEINEFYFKIEGNIIKLSNFITNALWEKQRTWDLKVNYLFRKMYHYHNKRSTVNKIN